MKGIKTLKINLKEYGLPIVLEQKMEQFKPLQLARVTAQHRNLYELISEVGPMEATITGKMRHRINAEVEFPAVGDWVLIQPTDEQNAAAVIHEVCPRMSVLARGNADLKEEGQVIAANIDTIFICMSLNADFNIRRVERYLTIAWESGATPVIVLTKADLCTDLPEKLQALEEVSMGIDVMSCSAETGAGYEALLAYAGSGKTIAFVGSSGVGKSTLINRLLGKEVLVTKEIRADDDKGRHTTTHRQLLVLPTGGLVIDTPGMRALQIYAGDLSQTFGDIEQLATQCKFSDCHHQTEPGCAVRAAIQVGTLSEARFASYQKLEIEMSYNGLNSRQVEQEKVRRMFGSKEAMKKMVRQVKHKNQRR